MKEWKFYIHTTTFVIFRLWKLGYGYGCGKSLDGLWRKLDFSVAGRACVSTVKKAGWILVSVELSKEGMGQVMLSAATAHIVGNHLAF